MVTLDLATREGKKQALRGMLRIREFEQVVQENFADGEIPGFVHLSIGQEAVAVGACGVLDAQDYITSTHRGHGHSLAKGLDAERLMAELYGKASGYCSGKGGSMHVADLDAGHLGAQGIVASGTPLIAGASLTAQLTDDDFVGLSFFGDGAMAAGQGHEAINLAATWDLPAIFVIENNLYSEGMSFEKQHNIEDLADAASAYGIPGEIVDGMDVEAVYEAVDSAKERALRGEGPTLIEAKTYRYRGHYEGDPEPYRSEEEVQRWREERDPIESYTEYLVAEEILSEDEVASLRDTVEEEIATAVEFARESPPPDPETAYEDLFVDEYPDISYFRGLRDAAVTDGGGR